MCPLYINILLSSVANKFKSQRDDILVEIDCPLHLNVPKGLNGCGRGYSAGDRKK